MIELPTGTVTFLFTDIEGSTRLVQELGEIWDEVLAEHCLILRSAIAIHSGTEISTEGDSFFAVFASALDAVLAAVEAQEALSSHRWPMDGTVVRVRMGIHTGEGRLGGDNYIGIDVHRAARIAAAGHGGQVVVSGTAIALVESSLPGGLGIGNLGEHRLKDLARPERLFQLEIEGLDSEFPALRTLDSRPNNLPVQLTSFLGRDKEVRELSELLQTARLVTLTGPGGTGKTRLALQTGAEVLTLFANGVFFVDLSPIESPELVATEIAKAVGVPEKTDAPLTETLREWLANREVLLVLDNFEHVIEAAPLVSELLASGDGVRIMVTSRVRLQLYGEHESAVPPLRLPEPDSPTAAAHDCESVALFTDRARAVRGDFALSEATTPAVIEITRRLDGLPLALELAAARTSLLGPEAILTRLASALDLLSEGARDLPERQQTLRGAIQWSHDLLAESERTLLRRLAVFSGGWTLEAVDDVCRPGELGLDSLEAMTSLADQSLIRVDTGVGEPRFSMLETIREFATERLIDSGEAVETRTRHVLYFLGLAERAQPELESSAEAVASMDRDHDNIRAALSWATETDAAEIGLRLGHAVWRYWQLRSHLREGRNWFELLLALPGAQVPTSYRALGLTGAASIAYWQNDFEEASAWYDESEAIYRELDDAQGLADALYNTGTMAMMRSEFDVAAERYTEGARLAEETGDDAVRLKLLLGRGYVHFMTDELTVARPIVEEAGRLAEEEGSTFDLAAAQHVMGQVNRLDGRYEEAAHNYRDAIRTILELGSKELIEPIQGLAAVAAATGYLERGLRLLGGAEANRDRYGGGPPPEWIRLGDPEAAARRTIGDEQVDEMLAEGRAMSDDEVVEYALGVD